MASRNAGRPTKSLRSDGESRNAGKLGPAARVPAKPLGEDGILNQNPIFEMGYSVVSRKNVTKVVWYILVQLNSLNSTMSMVSGVSVQVSERNSGQHTENK